MEEQSASGENPVAVVREERRAGEQSAQNGGAKRGRIREARVEGEQPERHGRVVGQQVPRVVEMGRRGGEQEGAETGGPLVLAQPAHDAVDEQDARDGEEREEQGRNSRVRPRGRLERRRQEAQHGEEEVVG